MCHTSRSMVAYNRLWLLLLLLLVGVQVTLSKIFGWYYPDFGADKAARLRFLLPYLPADKRSSLEVMLSGDPSAGGIRVEYAPYDWTINAAVE